MIFLSIEQVIEIHNELISEYGGSFGIRDMGILVSAIEMPKTSMFGEHLHQTVYDKAAAYLFHIVCNHAFMDGNKRTGTAAALIFLELNGITPEFDSDKLEELVCRVAKGKAAKKEISLFFSD